MKRVAIIGAGNVAWSMAPAVDNLDGYQVVAVSARSADKAREVADLCQDTQAVSLSYNTSLPEADIYIISVKDDAVPSLADRLNGKDALILHTSGGVSAEALAATGERYGVLYPLQTFTRGRALDFADIPLFIEGSNPEALTEIRQLAEALSSSVTEADSERRKLMHAAAVFACNFANFLWTKSQDLLEANGMQFDLLAPLISETLRKAIEIGPRAGQTGPARRGDASVMEGHKTLLNAEDSALYDYISRLIYDYYNK